MEEDNTIPVTVQEFKELCVLAGYTSIMIEYAIKALNMGRLFSINGVTYKKKCNR